MPSVHDRLREAGIRLFEGGPPRARPELARIAGLPRVQGCRSVGLFPAGPDVPVPPIALETALALGEVTGGSAWVVDAHGSWLAPRAAPEDGAPFSTEPLTERLALVTPRRAGPGWTLRALEACLAAGTRAAARVVVDLTGLDETGEHLEAMAMMDAVAVVAAAGRTTSRELARRLREVPDAKSLGALLVGCATRA